MIEFHRKMSNYISIGVDARIGIYALTLKFF